MMGALFKNRFTEKSSRGYMPVHTGAEDDALQSKAERRRYFIAGMLLSLCIAGFVAVFVTVYRRSLGAKDMHMLVSQFKIPITTEVFALDSKYALEKNESVRNAAWEALYPIGGGFVTGFEPDKDWTGVYEGEDQWCFSMYHQLHCLESLSRAAFAPSNGPDHETHGDEPTGGHNMHADHLREHLAHCVSYLIQAIQCAGDMSLEKATLKPQPGGGFMSFVTGWETEHVCRDKQKLFDFTSRHTLAVEDRTYD